MGRPRVRDVRCQLSQGPAQPSGRGPLRLRVRRQLLPHLPLRPREHRGARLCHEQASHGTLRVQGPHHGRARQRLLDQPPQHRLLPGTVVPVLPPQLAVAARRQAPFRVHRATLLQCRRHHPGGEAHPARRRHQQGHGEDRDRPLQRGQCRRHHAAHRHREHLPRLPGHPAAKGQLAQICRRRLRPHHRRLCRGGHEGVRQHLFIYKREIGHRPCDCEGDGHREERAGALPPRYVGPMAHADGSPRIDTQGGHRPGHHQ